MKVLTDIGGTYVRFAVSKGAAPEQIRKYEAADFPDLQAALVRYCDDSGIETGGELSIATAGYNDEGIWKFVNQNTWEIDPAALEAAGWNVRKILNDFEAATWSLLTLGADDQTILKNAKGEGDSLCLLGPGTGLGLGYLHKTPAPYVQKTHGGHMPVSCVSAEQFETVQAIKTADTPVVFENLASGTGLQKLRALYDEDKALRLFHEFLGLFAATAVITGNAYGGLYFTGGALERLIEEGKFDFETFQAWFVINGVDSVKTALDNTPIIHIKYSYPALKGLLNA